MELCCLVKIAGWVDWVIMDADFVVEVRSGTVARHAHGSDRLPFYYFFPGFDEKVFQVAEHGGISMAVIEANQPSVF